MGMFGGGGDAKRAKRAAQALQAQIAMENKRARSRSVNTVSGAQKATRTEEAATEDPKKTRKRNVTARPGRPSPTAPTKTAVRKRQ